MELLEIMDNYNYSESLRETLKEIYNYVLDAKNDSLITQFLKCLSRVEIVLTSDLGKEMSNRYNISLATQFFLSHAKGQYWIMPEILEGKIERKIFVKVSDADNLTMDEYQSLLHELSHLLRSYGLGEILYNENSFSIISGTKKSLVPIVDKKIVMNNLRVKNERIEERFVSFLSKYFDFLSLSSEQINQIIMLLSEEFQIMEDDNQEKFELFLNILIIKYFYDGDITRCFLPKYANFIEEAKNRYDISVVKKFVTVYQSRYNNKQELIDLIDLLDTRRIVKGKVV